MVVQNDKDFAALPEVAKLYQACKERDLTIAEREYLKGARDAWQSDKAQAVPEGFVLVEKELSWVKADHLACAEWEKNKALFCTENRDITALQIEEYRLRWCKNKAHKIMSEYKAMIEAQEQSHECPNT